MAITKRLIKDSPITAKEHDHNLDWLNQNTLNLGAFGIVMDDPSGASQVSNQGAMDAAIAEAIASGIETIVFPAGTLWVLAHQGTDVGQNLKINVPDGKTIRFNGAAGTVIKRMPRQDVTDFCPVVAMSANTGVTIEWRDITFDGNEANCNYDAGVPYEHEHSPNINWVTGTGTPENIMFVRCDVGRGRMGDGYFANVATKYFSARDCRTYDVGVRRTRSDWQFSRYAQRDTILMGCECNGFESEPREIQPGGALFISDCVFRSRFDLAGDVDGVIRYMVDAQLTNVRIWGDPTYAPNTISFAGARVSLVNCVLRNVGQIRRSKFHMIGGRVEITDAGGGVANPLIIFPEQNLETDLRWDDQSGNFATFEGVEFRPDTNVTTGKYIDFNGTATTDGQLGDEMVRTSLINCHTTKPLDYVFSDGRFGDVEIRGGKLLANTAIAAFSNDRAYYAHLILEPSIIWDAPALVYISGIPTNTGTGRSQITILGEFNAEEMKPFAGSPRTSAPSVEWRISATAHVDSDPDTRLTSLPGLIAKVRNPIAGGTLYYRASYSTGDQSGFGGKVWTTL